MCRFLSVIVPTAIVIAVFIVPTAIVIAVFIALIIRVAWRQYRINCI